MPSSARITPRPAREELRHPGQLELGHYSACLSASAGRRRAARNAPAEPAINPPRSASPNPSASTDAATGASSETVLVAVRAAAVPRPSRLSAAGRRGTGRQRRPERVDGERGEHAEHDPERTADHAHRERLRGDLPDDHALLQPSAFSVPSSRTRLPTDESVASAASRNAAAAATIASTKPRLCDRFAASTSEPLIWSATCCELATCACGSACSISFCTCATDEPSDARTSTTLARPVCFASVCSVQRQVDVGALASERRADDPDHGERRAVQVELRAELQRVLGGVHPETSASLPPAAARKRPFVTCES